MNYAIYTTFSCVKCIKSASKSSSCSPIFNKDISGNRVYVWLKCSHTAAHEHPEPHVVSNPDGGFDGDGLTEVIHVRTSFVQPVICTQVQKTVSTNKDKKTTR